MLYLLACAAGGVMGCLIQRINDKWIYMKIREYIKRQIPNGSGTERYSRIDIPWELDATGIKRKTEDMNHRMVCGL